MALRTAVRGAVAVGLSLFAAGAASAAPGDVVPGFSTTSNAPNATVQAALPLADGRVLIGGQFTQIGATAMARVALLDGSGALASGWVNPRFNNDVQTVRPAPNGGIAVGGRFTSVNGSSLNYRKVVVLDDTGTVQGPTYDAFDTGSSSQVYEMEFMSDGSLVAAGQFTTVGGQTQYNVVRFNSDGSRDPRFASPFAQGAATAMAITPEEDWVYVGGTSSSGISVVRLDAATGQMDPGWSMPALGGVAIVDDVLVQPNGKAIVVGDFTTVNGTTVGKIVRLNTDSSVDTTFNPGGAGANGRVLGIEQDSSGGLLVTGCFTTFNGASGHAGVVKLDQNGAIDSAFDASANFGGNCVQGSVQRPQGDVYIFGDITDITSRLVTTTVADVARLELGPTAPYAPTLVTAAGGAGQATVGWSAPAGDGGSSITGYTVTSTPDGRTCTAPPGSLTCVVTGLTAGTSYVFSVTAENASGSSFPSAPSNAISPTSPLPDAPTGVTASAGVSQASVSWVAPSYVGASAITAYTVTSSPDGRTCTASAPATTCTVANLTPGTAYTFTVTADNGAGSSSPSARSAAVTPTAPAPTPAPADTAASPTPSPASGSPCPSTFYQQAARSWKTTKAPGGASAVKVVSRIRIYEDAQAACRTDLTFIFRDARTKKRLAQLPGSTLGFRTLKGKDFSAPVISWPNAKEMRFRGGDSTGADRRNARLVLVSYLKRVKGMPAQTNVELLIVRRIPTDADQPSSDANPLFAQRNAFGTGLGWAAVS